LGGKGFGFGGDKGVAALEVSERRRRLGRRGDTLKRLGV
jgi:hypothetical protein